MRRLLPVLLAFALLVSEASVAAIPPARAQTPPPVGDDPRGLVYTGLVPAANNSICQGEYEQASRPSASGVTGGSCTHGPDPAPEGVDVRQRRAPLSPSELSAGSAAAPTAVPCFGSGTDGYRVHLVYARTPGSTDNFPTYAASFAAWAGAVDQVFVNSAAETGGVRHVRFETDASCNPLIDRITVSAAAMSSFDTMINELRAQGYSRSDRKYLLWADANVYCGIGEEWTDDSSGANPGGNANNGNPGVPATIARVDNGCWGRTNLTEAHELMHGLGGVQPTAPNATSGLHCTDESDRMCYVDGSTPTPVMRQICPVSHEALFDCNHDDYFSTAPPAGSYLATHWNTANNAFLTSATPTPPGTTTSTTTSTTTTQPPCPTPGSGPPGGSTLPSASVIARGGRVIVRGIDLTPNVCRWQLRLRDPDASQGETCYAGTVLNAVGVKSDPSGQTPTLAGTIPLLATTGLAQLCLATNGESGFKSVPVAVTLL